MLKIIPGIYVLTYCLTTLYLTSFWVYFWKRTTINTQSYDHILNNYRAALILSFFCLVLSLLQYKYLKYFNFKKSLYITILPTMIICSISVMFFLEGHKHYSSVPDGIYLSDQIYRLSYPLTFISVDSEIIYLARTGNQISWITHLLANSIFTYIQIFFYSSIIFSIQNYINRNIS